MFQFIFVKKNVIWLGTSSTDAFQFSLLNNVCHNVVRSSSFYSKLWEGTVDSILEVLKIGSPRPKFEALQRSVK